MSRPQPEFVSRLAETEADVIAAQHLRYEVFVTELGGSGEMVDHDAQLERDAYDPYCDHLLLIDQARCAAPVVGVYRLLRDDRAKVLGRYYSEGEYDLTRLKESGRRLLELGRSCLHPDYRGGAGMVYLWKGLETYIRDHGIEVLFGVASFHGTDIESLKGPLSLLHHRYLAPENLRVRALADHFQPMDLLPEDEFDRTAAMRGTPALIKAYLRLGGYVGEGAFVDQAFNTTDVCLIVDIANISLKQRSFYSKGTER